MDIEKLREKLDQYLSAAKLKLDEASKAIENDDFELANTCRTEADSLREKATSIKSQIESIQETDKLKSQKSTKKSDSTDAVRPPFEPMDNKEKEDEEIDVNKAVYVMRYSDNQDTATKAVVKDLYGNDYNQKRSDQMDAFVKFLRVGELELEPQERKLLKTTILRPESVKSEISAGYDLRSIKVNLQEMDQGLGGYLVPEDYRTQIITRLMGLTAVRPNAMIVTTARDAVEWPKIDSNHAQYTSGVRVTWVDEIPSSATVAQTNPAFGMWRVPVHTVMARVDLSRNLLEDSAFNLLQLLSRLFAEAMAIDEDNKFLTGRGAGEPRGVLGGGTAAEPGPDVGVASVATGDAGALTSDGLFDLYYGLHSQYRGKAKFIGARNTHRDIRKLKDGNNRYLWEDAIRAGEPPTLLSAPFLETESMPAVAANGYPIVFGDFRGYLIADRVGMEVRRVEDATTMGTNTVAIFARRRLGGQVIEPWRFQAQQVST